MASQCNQTTIHPTADMPAELPLATIDPIDDVITGAMWDGQAGVRLTATAMEFTAVDGSTFVVDRTQGMSMDVAQDQHIIEAISRAGLVVAVEMQAAA